MENRPFDIATVINVALKHKIDVDAIDRKLNDHIDLGNYGEEIEEIYVVFAEDNSVSGPRQHDVRYHEQEKLLELIVKIRNPDIVRVTAKEAMYNLSVLLLEAAGLAGAILPPHFECDRLKKDMEEALVV